VKLCSVYAAHPSQESDEAPGFGWVARLFLRATFAVRMPDRIPPVAAFGLTGENKRKLIHEGISGRRSS
jgi:hypothetical protein